MTVAGGDLNRRYRGVQPRYVDRDFDSPERVFVVRVGRNGWDVYLGTIGGANRCIGRVERRWYGGVITNAGRFAYRVGTNEQVGAGWPTIMAAAIALRDDLREREHGRNTSNPGH